MKKIISREKFRKKQKWGKKEDLLLKKLMQYSGEFLLNILHKYRLEDHRWSPPYLSEEKLYFATKIIEKIPSEKINQEISKGNVSGYNWPLYYFIRTLITSTIVTTLIVGFTTKFDFIFTSVAAVIGLIIGLIIATARTRRGNLK